MTYSLVGILAIFIHIIVNIDIFLNIKGKNKFHGEKYYLFFLLSVIAYHVTDGFWGILYDNHLANAVFIDTTVYFVAMAASILLWGLFVYYYLGAKNRVITYAGIAVFTFQIVVIVVNFFYPILFEVSDDCVYKALPVRYVMLSIQVFMFLLLSVYTFIASIKTKGSLRRRHIIISLFGLFMVIAITLQVFFPLLPMYSFGYLFGICALHAFVVEDEKANQRNELEYAKHRVTIDPLTGVLSKYAYVDKENEIDQMINNGQIKEFAMVVFDLNDLKLTNDTKGHEAGDSYIIDSVSVIKNVFVGHDIYRVGGDEFTVILTKEGYRNKDTLLANFNKVIDENMIDGGPVIAAGLSTFIPDKDSTILQTFTRADREMYARKAQLKKRKQ